MFKLTFSRANAKLAKLGQGIKSFALPSGWACPAALECLSKANATTGIVNDGKQTQFRCFSASSESLFPSLRDMVWRNFKLLNACKDSSEMASLILSSLPKNFQIMRVHVGGDFYSQAYFDAWLSVAKLMPSKVFYAYTKSLNFWVTRIDDIPKNFRLTASRGGKFDALIDLHGLKNALVVFSKAQAETSNLEIDHDDSHAAFGTKSFALLIHGTQPKGSKASQALSQLRKTGEKGYSKK